MLSLPPVADIIRDFDLRAQKSLGQNFLTDPGITDRIVAQAGPLAGRHVVEIGPGPGGLTRSIVAANPAQVTALEFDPRAVLALQSLVEASQGRLTVMQTDALHMDYRDLIKAHGPITIIANLPYNIATVLCTGWLQIIAERPADIPMMILMFQREVAERLTAPVGDAAYGRLSILTQWLCDVERVITLAPGAFFPAPKVHSSVVRFIPRVRPPDDPPVAVMEKIVAAAFSQRRKMIRTTLKPYANLLRDLGIDETLRAEDLTVDQYRDLAGLVQSVIPA